MLALGPLSRHEARAQALARIGVTHCHVDVADHDDGDDQRKPVMHEGGSGTDIDRKQSVKPEHRSRHEHHDDGAELECRVELLAGIELTHLEFSPLAIARAQPLPVDLRESVEPANIKAEGEEEEGDDDRYRKRESQDDMRDLEEVPITHECADIRDVEECSSDD